MHVINNSQLEKTSLGVPMLHKGCDYLDVVWVSWVNLKSSKASSLVLVRMHHYQDVL